MDLALQGTAHCALSTCNELDLLPIRCVCEQLFCRHHISAELHDCPANSIKNAIGTPCQKLDRCVLSTCSNPSLVSCTYCHLSFCVEHRHSQPHACTEQTVASLVKNEAARALLAKHFPPSSTTSVKKLAKLSSDPKKIEQRRKVELMKMRHKAKAGNPRSKVVPIDQRLHLQVRVEDSTSQVVGVFWFEKDMITGRVLDLLAESLGFRSTDSLPVVLITISDSGETVLLTNSDTLDSQVKDGDQVILKRQPLAV